MGINAKINLNNPKKISNATEIVESANGFFDFIEKADAMKEKASLESPTSSNITGEEGMEIVFVPKHARLSEELPTFSDEFYAWKKNFWRERIACIKHVVAPMVDQSELAFRMFLRERGAADLGFTPMIHASLFVADPTYRRSAFSTLRDTVLDRPLIVQFCANDARILLDACRLVESYCDGVDLNLGCPQLIAKRGRYGSFLQEFPDLISEMVRSVHAHCRLPISVKIRALATVAETVAYARRLTDAGAAMITVHGRVREQRGVKTGLADWHHIRAVKKAVDIPVIANGNIQLFGDVERCLRETGADAIMSAEGILSNPLLFTGKNLCAFDVARDYLSYATRYKANVSAIRAHIFRICHHSLLKHHDLREKTSYVFTIDEFYDIVNELEQRYFVNTTDNKGSGFDATIETGRKLILSEACQRRLAGESQMALKEENEKDYAACDIKQTDGRNVQNLSSFCDGLLAELINSVPHWVCKPYVRPFHPQNSIQDSDENNASKTISSSQSPPTSEYRAARRAEMARLSAETGLSKRQLRRRERRRVEVKRKAHVVVNDDLGASTISIPKKRRYPPCERCSLPAGANCEQQLCKRCCKMACVRLARDCKMHGFNHEKIHEKRLNYAQRMGLSMDELLQKEVQDLEHQKFLKNAKKTPLDLKTFITRHETNS